MVYVVEYIYLNQSTVNIMFKNEKDLFYDATMKLSEEQGNNLVKNSVFLN